jgi:hypothetical protein
MNRPTLLLFALAFLVVGFSESARAQLPQPRLKSLSRMGGQVGESVDLTLRGTDLEGVDTLWFDHPGLRAFRLKGLTFRVACATGVTPGHHDLRAVGPFGLSNPRTFVVGERPESIETEPNNTPAQANTIALNSVVNGETAGADVDCFAFEGRQGQRIFLDLAAERIESRLDGILRVVGPSGEEIAENRDYFRADPFLDLTLPADGRYVVKVHDVTYGGSTEHGYRLTLHDGPHLDAMVPSVAAPGVPTTFTLLGRNLGGTPATGLMIEGRPLEKREVTITPPPGDLDPANPSRGLVSSPAAPRRGFEYAWSGPNGTSNALFIAEAVDPVVMEAESNDDKHPQAVTLPCDISGTFGAPGDLDVYRFPARKGEVWWIEASAERLGSPADPVFVVQKVVPNGPPQDLATAEDTIGQGRAGRFDTATIDAVLRWVVPEDGTYQVAINDLFLSQRGDPRLVYRLNIRPERPDFRLFLVPEATTQTDGLTVGAGGRASASLLAWRSDGFSGPIRVEARDLPPGVRCEPVVIATGQVAAPVVIEAADDAKPTVGTVRLVGLARWGDRKEALRYVHGASTLGPDLHHEVLCGGMIWPPTAGQQPPVVAPARLTRGFVVAVGSPAPFSVSIRSTDAIVAPGQTLDLEVTLARCPGFVESVALAPSALPPNLTAPAVTIAKESTTGTVKLTVAKNVNPGTYTFLFRGTGAYPFSKDPNAKTKPNVNVVEPTNPITLTVRPGP